MEAINKLPTSTNTKIGIGMGIGIALIGTVIYLIDDLSDKGYTNLKFKLFGLEFEASK